MSEEGDYITSTPKKSLKFCLLLSYVTSPIVERSDFYSGKGPLAHGASFL